MALESLSKWRVRPPSLDQKKCYFIQGRDCPCFITHDCSSLSLPLEKIGCRQFVSRLSGLEKRACDDDDDDDDAT